MASVRRNLQLDEDGQNLLPGGLSVGFMRFAAYVVISVGFSGSGDRERDESVAFGTLFRICLPTRYNVAARTTAP
jgi:hypothetical protein